MSEPQTPTGRMCAAGIDVFETGQVLMSRELLAAIEAEAIAIGAKQERERLRDRFEDHSIHVRGPQDGSAEMYFTREGMDYVIDVVRALLAEPDA